MRNIIIIASILFLFNACFVINATRENKFCGKYDQAKDNSKLDTSAFYLRVDLYENAFDGKATEYFNYLNFDSQGNMWSVTANRILGVDSLRLMAKKTNCYVVIDKTIHWEVYTDKLSGWMQYRGEIKGDTLKYTYANYKKSFDYVKVR